MSVSLRIFAAALACFAFANAAPAPDLELSAKFLPPRYRLTDESAAARLEAHFRGKPADSALEWRRGRTVALAPGALRRLYAEDGARPGESGRERARRRLREIAGPGLVEDPVHAGAGYLPDDFAVQSTPLWPLYNDGTVPDGVPGVDMGMNTVWERFDGGDSLVIAVIDAGINFLHPDLKDRWYTNPGESGSTQPGDPCWNGTPADKATNGCDDDGNGFVDDVHGWDFVDGDNHPQDFHGHGTMIAGQLAAAFDNGAGIAGMIPRVRILPVRVLSSTGFGYSSDISEGLRYAAMMGATAVSFSIGISTAADTVIRRGFTALRDRGIPVAAAAANDARDLDAQPRSPSDYGFANVYNVAAHGPGGALAGFSNYGANAVELAAPGQNIATTTVPPPVVFHHEDFEDGVAQRWTLNGFGIDSDTLEGAKSLRWISGRTAQATLDSLDLRGKQGGVVSFTVTFRRGQSDNVSPQDGDWIVVEAQRFGTNTWKSLAILSSNLSKRALAYNVGAMDGALFRLRFRADFPAGGDNSLRSFRLDDVRVRHADELPENQAQYTVTSGTSMAAPYVAGYAALLRLACDRLGVPFTRERMLAGVTPAPALAGKVRTGARLDVAKGLDFYLRTLPAIALSDSARTAWVTGTRATYSVAVVDSAGAPSPGWTLSVNDSSGGSLSGATYNAFDGTDGIRTLRFKAEKGPLVLRKRFVFQVNASGVSLAASGRTTPLLRIGGRAFALPPGAGTGSHRLRVEFFAADGRAVRTVEGALELPPGAAEYRVEGFAAPGVRAWLDGAPLRAARP